MPEHDQDWRRCRVTAGGGRRPTLTHRGRQKLGGAAARRNSPSPRLLPPTPQRRPRSHRGRKPRRSLQRRARGEWPRRASAAPPPAPSPPRAKSEPRATPQPLPANEPGIPTHHQPRPLRCPARGGRRTGGPTTPQRGACPTPPF